MLIGLMRPVESRTVEVQGASLEGLHSAVAAQLPEGWVIAEVPAAMPKGSQLLTSTATIVRRDGVTRVEADDLVSLEAKVPDGWQLLTVRSV